jgi:hypothetical protein
VVHDVVDVADVSEEFVQKGLVPRHAAAAIYSVPASPTAPRSWALVEYSEYVRP